MTYKDFVVRTRDWSKGSFKVEVTQSPIDRMRKPDAVQAEKDALLPLLAGLERKQLKQPQLIQLGEELARLLFPPTVRQMLLRSLDGLQEEEGLRIRMIHDDPQLAQFPWEYAYVQRVAGEKGIDGFLALDPRISIVRHESIPEAPRDVQAKRPLKVLVGLSEPSDTAPLNLEAETEHIQAATNDHEGLELTYVDHLTVEKLESRSPDAHIFHYSGHGTFGKGPSVKGTRDVGRKGATDKPDVAMGQLVLEDDKGKSDYYPADKLARLLQNTQVVMLGACETGRRDGKNIWTGIAPALMRVGIPGVVGMQFKVYDKAAIAFTRRFYQSIAAGLSLDEAVVAGRLAILNLKAPFDTDWGTPVLYMRAGESVLFPQITNDPALDEERHQLRIAIQQRVTELKGKMIGVAVDSISEGDVEVDQEADVIQESGEMVGFVANSLGDAPSAPASPSTSSPKKPSKKGKAVPQNVDIHIDQQVGQNQGNMVGANINIGVSEATAPDRDEIASYLHNVVEKQVNRFKQITDEKLKRLWWQPFFAHEMGRAAAYSHPVYESVVDMLNATPISATVRNAVLLLGETGVGLSPAISNIERAVARKSLGIYENDEASEEDLEDAWIPLWAPLFELRPGMQLITLMRASYNRFSPRPISVDAMERMLEEYPCLIIFSDFDKLVSNAKKGLVQPVRIFMDTYHMQRYLVSCRESSYKDQFGHIDTLLLDPLTDEQVQEVLGDQFDERVLPLAKNRAMLDILIREETRLEEGMWSKGRLIQHMVRTQLSAHEEGLNEVELEMCERVLEQLAYRMHHERTYLFSDKQLMESITDYLEEWHDPYSWRQIAHILRSNGIIQQNHHRQWKFRSRPTQAYFVAAAIFHNEEYLPELIDNANDYWWSEPLELLVGLLDNPSEFLFDLLDEAPLVAARCLRFTGQQVDDHIVNALTDTLYEQLLRERSNGRMQLISMLTASGFPTTHDLLWQVLLRERKSNVVSIIAQALAGGGDLSLSDSSILFDEDEMPAEHINDALHEIIALWQEQDDDSPELEHKIEKLSYWLQHHETREEELVSGVAAIALGFIGADASRTEVRELLMEQLVHEKLGDFVAWCIVEALSQIRHIDVEKFSVKLFEGDFAGIEAASPIQRHYAVVLMGAIGGRLSTTIKALNDAIVDPEPMIRGGAVRAMGQLGWVDARERLEYRLDSRDISLRETDPFVLRRIAEALGKIGTLESMEVLRPYLRHEQLRTRRRVREAIAEIQQRYELS